MLSHKNFRIPYMVIQILLILEGALSKKERLSEFEKLEINQRVLKACINDKSHTKKLTIDSL